MSITSVNNSAVVYQLSTPEKTAQSATTSAKTAMPLNSGLSVLDRVDKKLQADLGTIGAKISSLGLLKSALADTQANAQSLSMLSPGSSATEVAKSMAKLFNSLNKTINVANVARSNQGSPTSAEGAARISADLQHALTANPRVQDTLKTLGLTVQSNGTITQDAKKFSESLNHNPSGTVAALATLGKQVGVVSSKELATGGAMADSLSSLNQQNTSLVARLKAVKAAEAFLAHST